MNSSVVVFRVDQSAVPVLEAKEWRHELSLQRQLGARLLTLYGGPPAQGRVTITAVLQGPDAVIQLYRTTAQLDVGYPELTTEWPAALSFERELHEQTGLRFVSHPWLKPLRYEGRAPAAMDEYPFYKVEGKEVHEVAVGPIHAGVIEPGAFRFMCSGERVLHLEIQLGYQHRGVERLLRQGDPQKLAPLVETIAGDTSVAHTWAYCAALESLSDCELDIRVEVARAVALELERVAMHLAGLSGLAADVGFLQGATSYGRLRTTAINTTLRLCGSRFGRGALRPGGIGMRLSPSGLGLVQDNLALLRRDLELINDRFASARTVRQRLRGIGVVSESRARELGLVGLVARASGVQLDARLQTPGGAYAALPIGSGLMSTGDCWARAQLRIAEMDASLAWLSGILALYPDWERERLDTRRLRPSQLVVALVEGWRGEVIHCLETDAAGQLAHYKVQDPSLRNWLGLAIAMRNGEISDFPICNKSFDLSYCGHDL